MGEENPENNGPGLVPCAVCSDGGNTCGPDCIFAPYFPHSHKEDFDDVCRLFGRANVMQQLEATPKEQRKEYTDSIIYEADARIIDPVGGCYGMALHYATQLLETQQRLLDHLSQSTQNNNPPHLRHYPDPIQQGQQSSELVALDHVNQLIVIQQRLLDRLSQPTQNNNPPHLRHHPNPMQQNQQRFEPQQQPNYYAYPQPVPYPQQQYLYQANQANIIVVYPQFLSFVPTWGQQQVAQTTTDHTQRSTSIVVSNYEASSSDSPNKRRRG